MWAVKKDPFKESLCIAGAILAKSMNNLPANELFSVYEIILLRIIRQDISSSHMFLLKF